MNSAKTLIVVHSSPEFDDARKGIRESWTASVNANYPDISVVFMLGTHGDKALMARVKDEAERFDDLVLVPVKDHYNNLSLKSIYALKYFAFNPWKVKPTILFKIDDDSYVNVKALDRTLRAFDTRKPFIMGHAFGMDNKPIFPHRVPRSKRRTKFVKKWMCPAYMFNGREYPKMVSGSGYIMNQEV